jgi:hypothetical protein
MNQARFHNQRMGGREASNSTKEQKKADEGDSSAFGKKIHGASIGDGGSRRARLGERGRLCSAQEMTNSFFFQKRSNEMSHKFWRASGTEKSGEKSVVLEKVQFFREFTNFPNVSCVRPLDERVYIVITMNAQNAFSINR